MKFALRYCNLGPYIDPARALELVQAGEEAGFESAWTIEHTVVPKAYRSSYPYSASGRMSENDDIAIPDPLIWLAYVAAGTSRIKLGTAILILPQHSPVVTAKQIATIDHMSGGRMLLGVGVGWLKEEFDAIGAEFETRGPRMDEYIAVMRELWSADEPTFNGDFIRFDGAYCLPQPVNKRVPVIIGGDSKIAARRAGRIGDGYFPARGVPEDLFALARETAIANGRDPAELEFTASIPDDLDMLPRLAELGISRVTVPVSGLVGAGLAIDGPEDALKWRDTIERYADL
jgi:probable F420-dependent oxidoreductase